MPARKVPPPDFRYVWLGPGSSSVAVAAAGATAAAISTGACLTSFGQLASSWGIAALSLGAGAVAGAAAVARGRDSSAAVGIKEVAMAIVPWGVVLEPDAEQRVLRWPGIRAVHVETDHVLRGGIPSVVASVVSVRTDRETFVGRAAGSVALERLVANLDEYAEEASRPVACDLDGAEALTDELDEPIVERLLQAAQFLCTTGRGAARLSLPLAGYRDTRIPTASVADIATLRGSCASPETLAELRAAFEPAREAVADPRPLASMVAALLEARSLVPDLLRLASAPHPLVAAVAKAAALRLGAPPNRAGCLDEVAAFLIEEDRETLERWAAGERISTLVE